MLNLCEVQLDAQDQDELHCDMISDCGCLLSDTKDYEEDYRICDNAMVLTKTSWPITSELFNELFPFNIVFDSSLIILATGDAFSRLCPSMVNHYLTDFFKIHAPVISFTYDNIMLHKTDTFSLSCIKHCPMKFKGDMIVNEMSVQVVYICSPVLESFEYMNSCKIFVSDLLYLLNCQETVFLNMHLITAKRVRASLEAAKHSVYVSQQEREAEKQRSLDLLHSILPSCAVETYLKGEEFEATKYDNVTVLFSDIEGFANICDFYEPLEAVKMLDSLFSEFDHLSELYGVFKVCNT